MVVQYVPGGVKIHWVDGFAADGVRSVELVTSDGNAVRRPVTRNAFSFDAAPRGAVRIVARAVDGAVVAQRPLLPRG